MNTKLFLIFLYSFLAGAIPKQPLSIDVGFGLPEFYTANVNLQVWRRFQFGLGHGFLPAVGPLATGRELPPQFAVGPGGIYLWIYPKATGSFAWFNPYVRFFPGNSNFYFQFSYFYYSATLDITSRIEDGNSMVLTNDGIAGTITIKQYIPTLSIGCIFGSNLYFFNMNMGYSFLGATSMSINLTGTLGGLGALAPELLEEIQTSMSNAVVQAAEAPKSIVANWPFPSIYFSFGVFF